MPTTPGSVGTRTTGPPLGLPLGTDSVLWRVITEPATIVASGPRALLLQVAHPLVAAGVEQHSDYEDNPWRRLYRTLEVISVMTFGTPARSARMAELLRLRHAAVKGVSSDGQPYRALDTDLLLWVWATLLDTLVTTYERHVRPLRDQERAQVYEEWKLVGRASRIPASRLPESWSAFCDYVERIMRTDLRVTPTARTVAAQVVHPPLPWPVGAVAGALLATLTAPTLPDDLRHELGLRPPLPDPLIEALATASRIGSRLVPGRLRRLPLGVILQWSIRPPLPRPLLRLVPAA
ncbi:MAG: oxygenase MpaB family protein [Acidimicrobiales bacterium]